MGKDTCLFLIAFAWLAACAGDEKLSQSGSDGHEEWIDLAHADAWEVVRDANEDPWPEHRPKEINCEGDAWYEEQGIESDAIECDTSNCNYLLLKQPLDQAIDVGDSIDLFLWWQTLASMEPAQGHLAFAVGKQVLWEEYVDIPGDADVRQLQFKSLFTAAAGENLYFHLHNHGANTWRIEHLRIKK